MKKFEARQVNDSTPGIKVTDSKTADIVLKALKYYMSGSSSDANKGEYSDSDISKVISQIYKG